MFVWQLHSISCLLTMSIPFCATYCTLSEEMDDVNVNENLSQVLTNI